MCQSLLPYCRQSQSPLLLAELACTKRPRPTEFCQNSHPVHACKHRVLRVLPSYQTSTKRQSAPARLCRSPPHDPRRVLLPSLSRRTTQGRVRRGVDQVNERGDRWPPMAQRANTDLPSRGKSKPVSDTRISFFPKGISKTCRANTGFRDEEIGAIAVANAILDAEITE